MFVTHVSLLTMITKRKRKKAFVSFQFSFERCGDNNGKAESENEFSAAFNRFAVLISFDIFTKKKLKSFHRRHLSEKKTRKIFKASKVPCKN
jgi:hypothetical protein